jgi:hypothetical protein
VFSRKVSTKKNTGSPYGGSLDSAMVFLFPSGFVGIHGYWVQPSNDGCSEYFLPGYLTTY